MGPRQKSLGNQGGHAHVRRGYSVLQWGRGKKASEIMAGGGLLGLRASASMGPRQKSLGNH